ncbi:MAG: stage III sporulation protein AE [Defluviitaleaceae bacterium]|nr:stage III sporulation protein AE [Defluviitaleaceae bacterium]
MKAASPADMMGIMQLERYETGALNMPGMPGFLEIVQDAIAGQLDLSLPGVLNLFLGVIFQEFLANGQLVRQLLVVAILGALMSVLTEAFSHKGASEAGFYVTYLMAVLLAVSSFYLVVGVLTGLVDTVSNIMRVSIPMMAGLMSMGGNFVGAAAFHPLLFMALQIVAWFVSGFFVPLVLGAAGLEIASKLSPDGAKLDMLAEIVGKVADWGLKGIIAVFMFLLTLQRITAPIISNVTLRTSRSVVGAVPIVGDAFTAAMDTVINFSQAARSGVLVALVLILCAALIAPLVKILVLSTIYKLTAAFLQPIADKRLISLMNGTGKYMLMMFSAAALLGVMCVYTVVILLTF